MKTPILALIFLNIALSSCDRNSYQNEQSNTQNAKELKHEEWNKTALKGEVVFESNCKNCHTAPDSGARDGTDWSGIFQRIPDEYILEFILSSSGLRKAGDPYAIELKREYGNYEFEHEFGSTLSHEEVLSLMVYLKSKIETGAS